jgi:hypothetical protein
MARNTEKVENEKCTSERWRENRNMWKMRQKHCLTRNMARNTEKGGKCEMHTVGPGVCIEN